MCFTQPISLVFTLLGFALLAFVRYLVRTCWKNDKSVVANSWRFEWGVLYFTSMELLQFFQYFWLDECDHMANKVLTIIGMIHICFQPYFGNLLGSFDATDEVRHLVDKAVLPLSFLAGLLMASRWIGADAFPCDTNVEPMCGKDFCTYSGSIHLSWHFFIRQPNYWSPSAFLHSFTMFAPMIILYHWPRFVFSALTGPVLAYALTRDKDEWASVWCFYSAGQLALSLLGMMWDRRNGIGKKKDGNGTEGKAVDEGERPMREMKKKKSRLE